MPVLRQIRERFERERPLDGLPSRACLHVTAETANLVRTLHRGRRRGGAVRVEPAVHAGRHRRGARRADGVPRCSPARGEDPDDLRPPHRRGARHAAADDDRRRRRPRSACCTASAPTCSTASLGGDRGDHHRLIRLRALEAEGKLRFPVIAVNEARTERPVRPPLRHRPVDARRHPARHQRPARRAQRVVVLGYGALRARAWRSARAGAGAHVIVCEVDPLRALEAVMDGYEVMPRPRPPRAGDVFITVTGDRDVLAPRALRADARRRDRGNAGHFDVEISKPRPRRRSPVERREVAAARGAARARRRPPAPPARRRARGEPGRRRGPPGRGDGRGLREPGARGSSTSRAPRRARAGACTRVPEPIDREVARLKLESLGVEIDALTAEQSRYLHSWEQGT